MPKARTKRFPRGSTRERILAAAEGLFAEAGLDGVSFRDLAGCAGVSLSATHYHFGSKHALLDEILTRGSHAVTEARAASLKMALAQHVPSLEAVIEAFLRPALDATRSESGEAFNRLHARLAVERGQVTRQLLGVCFGANDELFLKALAQLLPDLPLEDLRWRFHFLVGAMIQATSDSGRFLGLSGGPGSPADTPRALDALVKGFAALFRAPSADGETGGRNAFSVLASL
ncbi:TetR/AcrR family transcriptional regulator [Beijerinckia sp. L45]|uniref:TetR/AcrR family transcriptional regulator n=1 Tax=Beijerinckia sp. L45 TaxID=1641855 RepID=UPI00131E981F|nr:TetR/AcrR family transcriptional regulator [Beijerinckia sp. L45]